jgi:hypothetical protein
MSMFMFLYAHWGYIAWQILILYIQKVALKAVSILLLIEVN